MTNMKTMGILTTLGLTVSMAGGVHAAQLIQNGGFETTTKGGGQMGYNTNASGWSTTGYNFIFTPGSADTTGVTGQNGNLQLWGPGSKVYGNPPKGGPSANGLPASSPNGGNYVAADGAYGVQPITQTVTGLTTGHYYALNFDWAAAQQYKFDGKTTDQWIVKFGNDTQSTAIDMIGNHGFSGWQNQTFVYKATGPSELLSFMANGTPTGTPPFALLDGVSMVETTVPEPSALASMFVGGLGLAVIVRRRTRAKKSIA